MSDVMADQDVGETQPQEEIPILFLHQVERTYKQGDATLHILNNAELALWAGQSVALVAPSGAGKSTLLHIAGLLEHPDHGDVYIDGQATAALADSERTRIRRNEVGFIYQSHRLLPEFTALENVVMPQMIRGLSRAEAKKRGAELLDQLMAGQAPPKENIRIPAVGVVARCLLWQRWGQPADGDGRGYMAWIYYDTLCRFDAFMPGVALAMLRHFHRPAWDRLMARGGGLTAHECQALDETIRSIHARGTTIVWIEHIVHALLSVAQRLVVMNYGQLIADGEPHAVMADPRVQEVYMGIAAA